MRGAGRHIAAESLVQAERNTLYSILTFERFKRTFAVDIFSDYLQVLRSIDSINNAEQNYRSLVTASRALKRQADAGRRNPTEVDQAVQDELRARDAWIRAIQNYERLLDARELRSISMVMRTLDNFTSGGALADYDALHVDGESLAAIWRTAVSWAASPRRATWSTWSGWTSRPSPP